MENGEKFEMSFGSFGNKSISYQMKKAFLSITALVVVIGVLAITGMGELYKRIKNFNEVSMEVIDQSWAARRNLLGAQCSIYKLCLTKDETLNKQYAKEEQLQKDELQNSLQNLKTLAPENKTILEETETMLESLSEIRAKVMEYGIKNETDKAVKELEASYVPVVDKMNQNLLDIAEHAHQKADNYEKSAQVFFGGAILFILVILVYAVLHSILVSRRTIKGIVEPLLEIEDAMEQMADGNLGFELEYHSNNELGRLAHKIRSTEKELQKYIKNIDEVLGAVSQNDFTATIDIYYKGDFYNIKESIIKIIEFLNHITSKISRTTDVVSVNSGQISEISQSLADGVSNQASIVEELLATITEVVSQVQLNADKANTVSDKSVKAGDVIDKGNTYMQELQEAMNAITETSKKISYIISAIEDISTQTNLLALNASIEAARAGEHGRGFAVVANEIGLLANQTNEATKTSAELIGHSIQAVENGERLTKETADVLKEVVSAAGEITTIANEVADASATQAKSLEEISSAVEQISGVVQKNSALAQETSSASEELTQESQELEEIMSRFTLKK